MTRMGRRPSHPVDFEGPFLLREQWATFRLALPMKDVSQFEDFHLLVPPRFFSSPVLFDSGNRGRVFILRSQKEGTLTSVPMSFFGLYKESHHRYLFPSVSLYSQEGITDSIVSTSGIRLDLNP